MSNGLVVGGWKLGSAWCLVLGAWCLVLVKLEVGSWKLEVGSWKLEVGSWKLEVGRWELGVGSWTREAARPYPGKLRAASLAEEEKCGV